MPVYRIYKSPAPFNAADLGLLNYAQVADVVYFAHTAYPPWKLIRLAHADWTFVSVTFAPTQAAPTGLTGTVTNPNQDAANGGNAYFPQPASYVVTAVDNATGQESRASSSWSGTNDLTLKRNYNTLNWTAPTWSSAQGGYYRVYKADNTGFYGYIGATDSTSFVDDNIDADLSSGPPTAYNPFDAAGDYPGTVRFHEQRSWWGNTTNHPNAIYGSRSADYENMDYRSPGQEDDSIAVALVSDKVNVVNNLVSTKQGLLALTTNAIFSVQGSNENYITATPPPRLTPEITRGVSTLHPVQIDDVMLYQTVKTGEIRALGYQFEIDGLKTDDVSIFSRHLFDGHSIIDWAWSEKPLSAIIALRDDGVAVVLTWDKSQEVWGWTTWSTNGAYTSVCSITEDGEDRIYVTVRRTIGGQSVTYVERFASELWTDPANACYLDCAKTYANIDTSQVTFDRLDHLEGETVYAWVDGALYTTDSSNNPLVVRNGSVTLTKGGATVTIGLPFTAQIETLPLAMQGKAGWTIARPQDITKAVIKVVETSGIEVGPGSDLDAVYPVKIRKYENFGTPTQLFTGNLELDLAAVSGDEATVYIKSDVPTPMHIVGVMVEPKIGDKS